MNESVFRKYDYYASYYCGEWIEVVLKDPQKKRKDINVHLRGNGKTGNYLVPEVPLLLFSWFCFLQFAIAQD